MELDEQSMVFDATRHQGAPPDQFDVNVFRRRSADSEHGVEASRPPASRRVLLGGSDLEEESRARYGPIRLADP